MSPADTAAKNPRAQLPEADGDFYQFSKTLYSDEGTREMNALIVGRAITGFSAFVWTRCGSATRGETHG